MAIADYLIQLDSLRDQLANNLVEKGVDATQDESLTELIPKVLEIAQGGGGSGCGTKIGFVDCREDRSFISKTKIVSGMTKIYLQSDTLLSPDLTINDFTLSSNITGVTYINENLIKVTFATLTYGSTLTLQAKASAYLYENGTSAEWKDTVRDLLKDYYFNSYGGTYITRGVRTDSGSWSFTTSKGFPVPNLTVQIFSEFGVVSLPTVTSFSVNSDSFVTPNGRSEIKINQRDASSYNISWMICPTKDCGDVLKIRWEGYAHYNNANVDQIWELYIFANGDYSIVYEKKNSQYTGGNNSIYGASYTQPAEGAAISFYATDASLLTFDQISEFYNIKHHHNMNHTTDPIQTTLAAVTGTDAKDQYFINSSNKQDDNSFTLKVPQMTWSKNGTNCNYITISGNTWFGIGSSNEDITLNRLDAALYSARVARFKFSDMGGLECFKFVWKGSSRYNSSIDQEWELFLFANGDAMIHLTKLGSNRDGFYSFFGNDYKNKITPGGDCSFYRTNAKGTSWEIVQGTYDISKHHNV